MDGAKGVVTLSLSLKDGKTLDEPVRAEAEVLVVDPVLPGVHRDERVADDVLEERARVDLAEDEAERVRGGVGEHDELVARERLVEVQLVRRRLVVDERLVPARREYANGNGSGGDGEGIWGEGGATYFPESFLIMFRRDSTTPYTSFASSSNGRDAVGGGGSGAIGLWVCVGAADGWASSSFTATTNPDDKARDPRLPYRVSGFAEGYTEAYTAGSMPPSTAVLGRTVRCQS